MSVPVSTPGSKIRARAPSRPPSAMIVGMPAAAALRAASIFDAMPPVPTPVRAGPAARATAGSSAAPVGEVGVGQQHLGHVAVVRLERALVRRHEADLPDGGRRLPPLDAASPRAEPRRAGRDGARADHHDLPAAIDERRDLRGDRPHAVAPEPARTGEHVAAHLDDGAPDTAEEPRLLDEMAHGGAAAGVSAFTPARARASVSATTRINA